MHTYTHAHTHIELQQAEDLSMEILTSIGLSNEDAAKVYMFFSNTNFN